MHILLIHQAYAGLDEAGGTRHHELASYLQAEGHRLTIIASPVSYMTGAATSRIRWAERSVTPEGITVIRAYTYSALHRSFFHRILSFLSFMFSSFFVGLSVDHVDLVWGTSPPIFQGFTAWLLARLKGVRFLFEVRDLWPAFAIAVGVLKNPLLVRLSLWLEGFLYRHANHVMVNSPGYITHVKSRGARVVTLIPNGADPAMFDPQSNGSEFRQTYGLTGKYVVLYAGAHGLSNDLQILLDAAKKVEDNQDIVIVLLGSGKEKAALQAYAQAAQLTNVTFLPPLPKSAMTDALAAADACVAILKPIELYKTTYPNKVFDYMAAGRPVILAIDGVIRAVVEDAQAGIFVTPGDAAEMADAIRTLAADPALGRKMGLAGRQYIETKFNRSDIAAEFGQLLDEVMRHE